MDIENINKDFYYSKLYKKHGYQYIKDAGYFENDKGSSLSDCEIISSLKLTCTPLPIKKYSSNKDVVLLTTGCFNPLHDDHIKMILTAEKWLMDRGLNVVHSYIAPDHDNYASSKSNNNLNAYKRIQYCNEKLKSFKNISVDPWASVYLDKEVNFTTIYRRLELYLSKYYGDVDVYYVVGSDNYKFKNVFDYKTLVVYRQGYKVPFSNTMEIIIPETTLTQSSTNIRKQIDLNSLVSDHKNIVNVRVDNTSEFEMKICDLLQQHFKTVNITYISSQYKVFNSLAKNMISLDSVFKAEYNIQLSRLYNVGGFEFISHTNRNGTPKLHIQANKIPKDKPLYLFDDDSFTGGTFNFTKQLLSKHTIIGTNTLLTTNSNTCEILDARDFDFGKNNGLLINIKGKNVRVPYILPFVDIYQMASIKFPFEFTNNVLNLLIEKYLKSGDTIKSDSCFEILSIIGFNESEKVYDCLCYLKNKLNERFI